MSNLNLSQINDAVEKDFGDFTINLAPEGEPEDLVRFRYFLRASKASRKKLADAFAIIRNPEADEQPEEDDKDGIQRLTEIVQDALKALAVTPGDFTKLRKAIGDDLTAWGVVLTSYGNRYRGQVGEASPSEK